MIRHFLNLWTALPEGIFLSANMIIIQALSTTMVGHPGVTHDASFFYDRFE